MIDSTLTSQNLFCFKEQIIILWKTCKVMQDIIITVLSSLTCKKNTLYNSTETRFFHENDIENSRKTKKFCQRSYNLLIVKDLMVIDNMKSEGLLHSNIDCSQTIVSVMRPRLNYTVLNENCMKSYRIGLPFPLQRYPNWN